MANIFKRAAKGIKKAGQFVGDVGKGIADGVHASTIGAVTGKDWTPNYKTKAGRALGLGLDKGNKALQIVGKTAGDAFTFNNASKLANKFRKKEYRESAGHYNEMRTINTDKIGIKAVDKSFAVIGAISPVVGSVIGARMLGGAGKKIVDGFKGAATKEPANDGSQESENTGLLALAGGLALLLLKK